MLRSTPCACDSFPRKGERGVFDKDEGEEEEEEEEEEVEEEEEEVTFTAGDRVEVLWKGTRGFKAEEEWYAVSL